MTPEAPMPDDDAFLRAIIDNPDDDLPRLVYADWLDEHGDPQRAELIRVQCELAALSGDENGLGPLGTRERRLLQAHFERWFAPFASFSHVPSFRRGFVESFTTSVGALLRHAEQVWSLTPLQGVTFVDAWEDLEKLAASPHVGRLRSMNLFRNNLGTDEVRALAASPYIAQLRILNLAWNRFDSRAVEALADSPAVSGIWLLDLSVNDYGAEGLGALARSPYFHALEMLRLEHSHIGPAGVEALCAANGMQQLRTLSLANNPIGTRGIRALIHSTGFPKLTRLSLSSNQVDSRERASLEHRFGPGVCVFD
jgi:uncharacterized protein (TIGR02996 family)